MNDTKKQGMLLVRYAKRAYLWSALYYASIIFAMFYLRNKVEIKNRNMVFVFLPLLILAISSETMSRNTKDRELNTKILLPYSLIDFILKIIVCAIAQLIHRNKVSLVWRCLIFTWIGASIIVSFWFAYIMVKKSKNFINLPKA